MGFCVSLFPIMMVNFFSMENILYYFFYSLYSQLFDHFLYSLLLNSYQQLCWTSQVESLIFQLSEIFLAFMFYFGYFFNSPDVGISFLLLRNKVPQTQQPKTIPIHLILYVGQNSGRGIDGVLCSGLTGWNQSTGWSRVLIQSSYPIPSPFRWPGKLSFVPAVMWPSALRDYPSLLTVYNMAICFLPQGQHNSVSLTIPFFFFFWKRHS